MAEKIYCNAFIIKSKRFDDGAEMLKASVKVDELVAFLNQHAVNGWVNLDITRRREPGGPKKDITHSVTLNTWKPDNSAPRASSSAPLSVEDKPEPLPF